MKLRAALIAALLHLFSIAICAQTVSVVANLTWFNETPSFLTQGQDGSLYGVSFYGGSRGVGSAFKVDPSTGIVTQIHSFVGSNGSGPDGLTLALDGDLYGDTDFVGGLKEGYGEVFKITPSGDFDCVGGLQYQQWRLPLCPASPGGGILQGDAMRTSTHCQVGVLACTQAFVKDSLRRERNEKNKGFLRGGIRAQGR
jgi:uncharacterized repeat protein (TIGR03803 family)